MLFLKNNSLKIFNQKKKSAYKIITSTITVIIF